MNTTFDDIAAAIVTLSLAVASTSMFIVIFAGAF
jgi:hypothetical protein